MRSSIRSTIQVLASSVGLGLSAVLSVAIAPSDAALLVGNTRGNNVVLYGDDGTFKGNFIAPGVGGLLDPDDLTFGPDGNLYVSSGDSASGKVLRYNGKTGEFLGEFVKSGPIRPYGNAFGPDGNFYVSSFLTDEILRFNGKTGDFVDVFASAKNVAIGDRQSGFLNGPNDLLFTPDGRLLVTTQGSVAVPDPDKPGFFKADFSRGLESQVLSYDIRTGQSQVFVAQPAPSPDSVGFVSFLGLGIGPQGDLFVSDFANDIRRYDLQTGGFKQAISTNYTGQVPSSSFIGNLTFDPSGNLYTVGFDRTTNNGAILRYDGFTGNSRSLLVAPTSNLNRPIGIAYVDIPEPGAIAGLAAVGLLGWRLRKKRSYS